MLLKWENELRRMEALHTDGCDVAALLRTTPDVLLDKRKSSSIFRVSDSLVLLLNRPLMDISLHSVQLTSRPW